jgi:hypothetical protein
MSSFLGVPLYVHGEVFGNLYFTEKLDSEVFTDIDEELAVALAGAAAISIENARLHTRTQELTLLTERERFGRDLHDTVIQRVFATGLAMHTTARMVTDPEVQSRIVGHIDELDQIVRELRTAIFQLEVRRASGGGVREQILSVVADWLPCCMRHCPTLPVTPTPQTSMYPSRPPLARSSSKFGTTVLASRTGAGQATDSGTSRTERSNSVGPASSGPPPIGEHCCAGPSRSRKQPYRPKFPRPSRRQGRIVVRRPSGPRRRDTERGGRIAG